MNNLEKTRLNLVRELENFDRNHIEISVKQKLERNETVKLSELLSAGYKFGLLLSNRDLNTNITAQKKNSIRRIGVISSGKLTSARECLRQGLKIVDISKKPFSSKENLSKVVILLDGQHRFEAITILNKEISIKGSNDYFDMEFSMIKDKTDILTLLQDSNVSTVPWKCIDYITPLLIIAEREGLDASSLKLVKELSKETLATSAWLWGTLSNSDDHFKANLKRAAEDIDSLKRLLNKPRSKYSRELYETVKKKFSIKIAKLKITPLWYINKIEDLTVTLCLDDAIKVLMDFTNSVEPTQANDLSNTKASGGYTKDQLIQSQLDELFSNFSC